MNNDNPRKRKRPDRYGESKENMDDMFEEIDNQSTPSKDKDEDDDYKEKDEDDDYIDLSGSTHNVSNSEPFEKFTWMNTKDEFQEPQERQYARIEAKLNQIHSLLIQIQRTCISNATTSLLELERIPELPLATEVSLNKFELDLSEDSYRQKIVSTVNSDFIIKIQDYGDNRSSIHFCICFV